MWPYPVSIISYLVVAAIVVWLSIKLSTLVDLLDKKTNLSGALLGGILLAATTSLPELFTSFTATVLVKNNSLVMGNILGSNIFNMVLFTIIYLFFFKKVVSSKVDKSHTFTMVIIGLLYVTVTVASYVFNFHNILWGWFNPLSILIVVLYAINIWKTPKEEDDKDNAEEDDSPKGKRKPLTGIAKYFAFKDEADLTVKQVIVLFILYALALIGASIGITYLTDWVVSVYGFGSTFGGALFLGVATSLPELTATINLSKRGNVNAAYGNIIGSCSFNFCILTLADLMSFACSTRTYAADQSTFLLLVLGGFSFLILFASIIVKRKMNLKGSTGERIYFYITGILLVASYLTFLVLSNINLGLEFAPYVVG
ncbi:MAG: sodium:calcium antiporter [Bacilli bacterium]|nr:sodium:calcium antiporter [Bacilli bacterium]